jgi:iron complex outermembrane receptor protein
MVIKMRNFYLCVTTSIISLSALLIPTSIFAQDGSLALEVITVTAERRETSLQNTPAAIIAITGAAIESSNINNLNELTLTTPGINIQGINRRQQYVSMRGNVTESGDPGVAQSIGFFIDGLYFGRSSLFNQSLADIERIEVLRGPQGQLWGHNIVGGSINVITKDPTQEFQGDVKLTLGNYGRKELSGLIAGGLTDTLAGQLTFSSEKADGYVTNLDSGQDLGSEDAQLVRGKLVWDINENLTAKLSATYQQDKAGMNARNFLPGPDAVLTIPFGPGAGRVLDTFVIPENHEDVTYQRSQIGTNDFELKVLGLDVEYQFANGMTLSSLTGLLDSSGEMENFGFFPFPERYGTFDRDHAFDDEAFTQEIRLSGGEDSSVFWQVGAYYYDATNAQDFTSGTSGIQNPIAARIGLTLPVSRGSSFGGNPLADIQGNNNGISEFNDVSSSDTESTALFGQATWSINDWLSLTGGIRYTSVDKGFRTNITGEANGRTFVHGQIGAPISTDCGPIAGPGGGRTCSIVRNESDSWSNTSPKVTIDGQWEDVGAFNSILAYATYSEGWKEGGFQAPVSSLQPVSAFTIDPESAKNFEIGFKSRFWDNRASFNFALFNTEYEGQQTNQNIGTQIVTFNLDTEIDGLEIDGAFAVTDWLTLNYSAAFYDSAYGPGASLGLNPEDSIAGNNTVATPDLAYTIGWDAGTTLDNGMDVFFRGSYAFSDEVESDPDNAIARTDAASGRNLLSLTKSSILNATLGIAKDNWELSLWGRNLTDDYVATNVASFADFWLLNVAQADNPNLAVFEGTRTEPRSYGVSLRLRF